MTREEASDCISRKRAIERLKLNLPISQGADNSRDRHRYMQSLADIQAIRELPSSTLQESKFIAKSDGTIEQIKNCNDCLFKKEWEKIGKLLSVVLEKQTEQEQNTGHWIEHEHNGIAHIECSECSSWFLRSHLVRNSYCPNCGAKMSETEGKE